MTDNPKLFISYSWTTPTHEKWVVALAEELVSQGIDVVFDKWQLKPGHDANSFMESMVTDASVTKVVIVCDAKYAEKADTRIGGAGTEAQIITPQLYEKREQDKFVAVVREKNEDGTPCLPVYYKGRIFFDLSDDAKYAEEFERLVRWAWDKPAYVKPQLGKKPAFLIEDASAVRISTAASFRRAHEAIRSGRDIAEAALSEYFTLVVTEIEKFRITLQASDGDIFDERVVNNVSEFTHYRNEAIEIFISIAMYRPKPEVGIIVHRFFEQLEPYLRRPESINSWNEEDFDNFRFIIHELFLYAIAVFIKYERFEIATYLINTDYFTVGHRNDPMQPFTIFRDHIRSFEARSSRLGRLSSRADLLKERCQAVGVEFRYLMAADFVLYLRACSGGWGFGWWPETLLYLKRHSEPIEIFARAKSKGYFLKIAPMLGVTTKEEFETRLKELDPRSFPHWQFERINPLVLARVDELATAP